MRSSKNGRLGWSLINISKYREREKVAGEGEGKENKEERRKQFKVEEEREG